MKGSIFHKMQTSTCWIVCLVLLGVYLFAALRPGVWLRDAFLYRQADGSFSGKDAYAAYTLQLSGTESEAEAAFTLDGETRHYRIEAKDSAEVKLYLSGWGAYLCRECTGRPRGCHPLAGRRRGLGRRGEGHRQW